MDFHQVERRDKFPIFNGENPEGWIRNVERYFRLNPCTGQELIPKFRAEFKQLAAYLPCIPIEVLEDTYLKGLKLEIKSELTVYKPNGLGEIMDTLVQFEIHLQIV
ncbi:unnamed protein product [Spirodela intermedia]|uniref:Uncharacterized protein n=1 Tax=Spirodela intermedia TaxID=51605 RepID=A0A7I8KKK3_SPIIN|nr:unnamed protein product [Spirodela intermedia]